MISATSLNNLAATDTKPTNTPVAAGASTVTKNMFLQLLVSQIKNQDPLNPTDGTQFLTQLAQFQTLEQSLNMGQDLTAIRSDLDTMAKASANNAATTGTTTGTTSNSN
jgi:flagellar basal-body rod modification protein FlgD